MDGGFGDDVGVQPVTEVDGVDVVTASIAHVSNHCKIDPHGQLVGGESAGIARGRSFSWAIVAASWGRLTTPNRCT